MSAGFLLLNKPSGPTSHDVVDHVRRITGERTVGHAGTLDPFATGLLIVGVGREATREFPKLVGLDKHYRAIVHLGATSDTDDRTGRISTNSSLGDELPGPVSKANSSSLGDDVAPLPPNSSPRDEIETILKKFTGKIQQLPPKYSAKKIGGKKMYELARAGKNFERAPVEITVYEMKLVESKGDLVTIDVHCSSGTYIRALARDIGEALGTGAYLEELERTAIGPFKLEDSIALKDLNKENLEVHLLPVASVVASLPPSLRAQRSNLIESP